MRHFTHPQQKPSIFFGVGGRWGSHYTELAAHSPGHLRCALGASAALGAAPARALGGGVP